MYYQFENIDGLIEWAQMNANRKREYAKSGSSKKCNEDAIEATMFEYFIMVLENSDLKRGEFLMTEDAISYARSRVTSAVTRVDEAILALENAKLELLATVEGESVDAG